MADVLVKYTSDMQKLLNDQEKLIAKQEKTIGKLKATADASKKSGDRFAETGKKGEDAFGQKIQSHLLAVATKLFAVSTAARLVGDAMRYVQQETDKAMASFDRLDDVNRRLAQVATTAEDRQALEDRANQLAAKEGVSREQIKSVLFQARSAGFEGPVVDEIIQNAKVADVESQAAVAGQIPKLFDNQVTADEAINMTKAAAEGSLLSFEQIARAMPQAAAGASLVKGQTAEETFGLVSTVSGKTKSGEQAAEMIATFATKVSLDEDLRESGGVMAAVEKLKTATDEQRKAFLGDNDTLNKAYGILSSLGDEINKQTTIAKKAKDTAAGPGSFMDRARENEFSQDTEHGRRNIAQRRENIGEQRREIAKEKQFAETGFEVKAAVDTVQASMSEQGRSGFSQFTAEKAGATAGLVTQNEDVVAATAAAGGDFWRSLAGLFNPFAILGNRSAIESVREYDKTRVDTVDSATATVARQQEDKPVETQDRSNPRQPIVPDATSEDLKAAAKDLREASRRLSDGIAIGNPLASTAPRPRRPSRPYNAPAARKAASAATE